MFGTAKPPSDYLFFYLGAELHGRPVLNHRIYHGNSSLSFAIGIRSLESRLHGRRDRSSCTTARNLTPDDPVPN